MSPHIAAPQAPAPLPPVQQPTGTKPKVKSMQPTFLGAGMTAQPGQTGEKTLIGQ